MRTKKIIIARHGNTFRPGETPTRVGAKTDLPLIEKNRGISIGQYLKANDLIPNTVFAAPLQRTMQTAELAEEAMGIKTKILPLNDFVEIDYGPDENKTEEEVMLRLGKGNADEGKKIIDAWNKDATVPDGWNVNPQEIVKTWLDFAENTVMRQEQDQVALLVTSNGIIRFAPYLTGNFKKFSREHDIKVVTGGICIFEKTEQDKFWKCKVWNLQPYEQYNNKIDNLSNYDKYIHLHPSFEKVFKYLSSTDFSKIEMTSSKMKIFEDDSFYVNLEEADLRTQNEAQLEVHNQYIDIHLPLSCPETIGWRRRSACKKERVPYDKEKDIVFYNDSISTYFTLDLREFAIFFPEDAHAPLIGEGTIKKVIVKIKV